MSSPYPSYPRPGSIQEKILHFFRDYLRGHGETTSLEMAERFGKEPQRIIDAVAWLMARGMPYCITVQDLSAYRLASQGEDARLPVVGVPRGDDVFHLLSALQNRRIVTEADVPVIRK